MSSDRKKLERWARKCAEKLKFIANHVPFNLDLAHDFGLANLGNLSVSILTSCGGLFALFMQQLSILTKASFFLRLARCTIIVT
jgi:hypothetical protein